MQVRKQQLELDMEQQTGSKQEKQLKGEVGQARKDTGLGMMRYWGF